MQGVMPFVTVTRFGIVAATAMSSLIDSWNTTYVPRADERSRNPQAACGGSRSQDRMSPGLRQIRENHRQTVDRVGGELPIAHFGLVERCVAEGPEAIRLDVWQVPCRLFRRCRNPRRQFLR